jgi:cytosine/uracil/thiamine/allantoin permease
MAAIIAAFALLGWSVKNAGGGGPVLKAKTQLTGSALSWAWVGGINIAIAGKTTLALNMVGLPLITYPSSRVLIPSLISLDTHTRLPTLTGKCFSSLSSTGPSLSSVLVSFDALYDETS